MHFLKEGVQDGGQWDMFANIVKKYGVVSKYLWMKLNKILIQENEILLFQILWEKLLVRQVNKNNFFIKNLKIKYLLYIIGWFCPSFNI